MKRQLKVAICAALLISFMAHPVFAHSGRLDRYGGHWNHKTGTYHYHRGPRY